MIEQKLNHCGVHNGYTQQELYLMSQMPYQPMGPRTPLAGDAEVAGMFKKLAARSSPNVSVLDETQSPQEKSGPESWPAASKQGGTASQPPRPRGMLEWEDRLPGSMGRYTKCHWYSCCQIGQGASARFEVWTRNPLTGGMTQLALGLKDFNEGRRVAQADADEHYARGDQ